MHNKTYPYMLTGLLWDHIMKELTSGENAGLKKIYMAFKDWRNTELFIELKNRIHNLIRYVHRLTHVRLSKYHNFLSWQNRL